MVARRNTKKVKCGSCGAIMTVEDAGEDWLRCLEPTGIEWTLPSGVYTDPVGRKFYVDAFGKKMSKEEYIEKYGLDPEIYLEHMRKQKSPMKLGR